MNSVLVLLLLTIGLGAQAQEAANPVVANVPDATKDNSSYVMCRNQKQVRTIRVDVKTGSCKAVYTKDGKDEIVGKSATPDLCYDVVNKVRLNLEKYSWKCKDVNPDRVSFTVE